MSARIIGVDWGTTNLRAFLFDDSGQVVETRRSGAGLASVKDRAFEETLRCVIGDWLKEPARIFISGMAGAREGWVEAPYVSCPVNPASHAAAMMRAPATMEVWIAPGVTHQDAAGLHQIMRGEETQIFGADGDGLIICPGTHSKWARVRDGCIVSLQTAMTGELFALLKTQSILARLMQGDRHSESAFKLGVERAQRNPAVLALLFSVRSEGLFGAITPEDLASYLSGLLIGAEVAQFRPSESRVVTLIGAADICALYDMALERAGFPDIDIVSGEDAAARGLWTLAQAKAAT